METVDAKPEDNVLSQIQEGPLRGAVSALELESRAFPTGQDFHFYANFKEFAGPVGSLQGRVVSLLEQLGALEDVRSRISKFPTEIDDGYDWLVGLQDDLLERVDASVERCDLERKEYYAGKAESKFRDSSSKRKTLEAASSEGKSGDVKVARSKDKRPFGSPIPFHIRSIPRPQDKFDQAVDNSNTPFRHPGTTRLTWQDPGETSLVSSASPTLSAAVKHDLLSARDMVTESIHPLEDELMKMAYVEPLSDPVEIRKYGSIDQTPLNLVTTVKALQEMASRLRAAGEIAVDLENHHYRSYQGFVCLMQVSTRSEDFVVDALELRSHIGSILGDIFSDPKVRKVMHGADHDIIWLQRDFGIYVCNLFDTGQAARVLELPGFGLAYLLEHFCDVHADKRFQLADWRIRPLPSEMLNYAREDTHYLLYVHDMLKQQLLAAPEDGKVHEVDPYLQVCTRSRDICLKLYTKDVFTETSHQQIYAFHEKKFQPDQVAVLAALYAWRDKVARKDDESTGYVLPNHLMIQLATEMPSNVRQLQSFLKGPHSFVGQHAATVVGLILEAKEKAMKEAAETRLEQEELKQVGVSIQREKEISEGEVTKANLPDAIDEIFSRNDVSTTQRLKEGNPETRLPAANVSVKSEKVLLVPPKKKISKFGAMLGGPSRLRSAQTTTNLEVNSKTTDIEASLVLPFLSPGEMQTSGMHPTEPVNEIAETSERKANFAGERIENNGGVLSEEAIDVPNPTGNSICEDILMFETEADELSHGNKSGTMKGDSTITDKDIESFPKHRNWWPRFESSSRAKPGEDDGPSSPTAPDSVSEYRLEGTVSRMNAEFPLSLLDMHKNSRSGKKRNRGEKRAREKPLTIGEERSVRSAAHSGHRIEGSSFNYNEARNVLGIENLYVEKDDKEGRRSAFKNRSNKPRASLNKMAFDPLRGAREEPKPEGIQPGQRRQVFPQSGNRTTVFKK